MLKQFRRSGKVAYLDPIRGFLVQAKPEEKVRQEFLQRLMSEYGVPQSAIAVEYPLRRSGSASKRRADILVVGASGPLMVIECKEPNTPLHDGVHDQACDYADELECQYMALTNGDKIDAFHREARSWKLLAGFPAFRDMEAPRRLRYQPPKSRSFPPLTLGQLKDHSFLAEHEAKLSEDWSYRVLGEDTPEPLWTPIYSLYNALFHKPVVGSHLPRERGRFRVEEYLGIHFTEYGNYSGGKFPGLYSSFRVKDARGDDQIYKIAFFSTLHTENHPVWGNRKGTSGIHVAIDDFDKAPHMSLELSLDASLKPRSGAFDVTHDGKITVGRLGAAKRDVLLDFVAKHAPQLVRGRSVALGSFPAGRVLTFADASELVFNLLHYAEIRDRFRADYKAGRA
ncbi:MAG: type I restriction enzyme HsdR N-terminal domain-containing protein [Polyangiaceae bacterium]